MLSLNTVMLGGNVAWKGKIEDLGGTPSLEFSLAINTFKKRKEGDPVKETIFLNIRLWAIQAVNFQNYMQVGAQVIVMGRLEKDQWEKDGQKHSRLLVKAHKIIYVSPSKATPAGPDNPALPSETNTSDEAF